MIAIVQKQQEWAQWTSETIPMASCLAIEERDCPLLRIAKVAAFFFAAILLVPLAYLLSCGSPPVKEFNSHPNRIAKPIEVIDPRITQAFNGVVQPERWLNQNGLDRLTQLCSDLLHNANVSHPIVLREWVKKVYQIHNYEITSGGGGHMWDAEALQFADQLLNPPLLQKLQTLLPLSAAAQNLHARALEQNKPLSQLVFD